MKSNPVVWFEIYVEDMARARKFYESVFEVTLEKVENPGTEMFMFTGNNDAYGAHGALMKIPGFHAGKNSVLIYFACADCAVEEERVKKFGGRVEKSKFSIGPHGHISLVYDTEGNMFGLHSMAQK